MRLFNIPTLLTAFLLSSSVLLLAAAEAQAEDAVESSGSTGSLAAQSLAPKGMALVPAGPYLQGDNMNGTTGKVVTKTVSAFYIDRYEVSLALWQSVKKYADANGYRFDSKGEGRSAAHPVHTVNWYDCVKWCNARSEQAGKTPVYYKSKKFKRPFKSGRGTVYVKWDAVGFRLPTQTEWEKAARGGLEGKRFPWGDTISHDQANYAADFDALNVPGGKRHKPPLPYDTSSTNSITTYHPNYRVHDDRFIRGRYRRFFGPGHSPVGSFAPNNYELYDMAGNVREWCWDGSDDNIIYRDGGDPRDTNKDRGLFRIIRGGSMADGADRLRCWSFLAHKPEHASTGNGFRSVLPVGPSISSVTPE